MLINVDVTKFYIIQIYIFHQPAFTWKFFKRKLQVLIEIYSHLNNMLISKFVFIW